MSITSRERSSESETKPSLAIRVFPPVVAALVAVALAAVPPAVALPPVDGPWPEPIEQPAPEAPPASPAAPGPVISEPAGGASGGGLYEAGPARGAAPPAAPAGALLAPGFDTPEPAREKLHPGSFPVRVPDLPETLCSNYKRYWVTACNRLTMCYVLQFDFTRDQCNDQFARDAAAQSCRGGFAAWAKGAGKKALRALAGALLGQVPFVGPLLSFLTRFIGQNTCERIGYTRLYIQFSKGARNFWNDCTSWGPGSPAITGGDFRCRANTGPPAAVAARVGAQRAPRRLGLGGSGLSSVMLGRRMLRDLERRLAHARRKTRAAASQAPGPSLWTLGDSVTAGFGFYGGGTVNHAAISLCIQNPRPSLGLCQSPQAAAYPALLARQRGIADFRNFAISGTTPLDWLNQGCPAPPADPTAHCGLPLDLIAAREPTVIALTLGANPVLLEIADPDRPANKCFHGAPGDLEAVNCAAALLARVELVPRLSAVYRRLLVRPDGTVRNTHVAVLLYHHATPLTLAVPANAHGAGTPVKIRRMALMIEALNASIRRAVSDVQAELPVADRERLVSLDPNAGPAGTFDEHSCLSDRPWVLVYDLCIHPSAGGQTVFADTLDRWAGPLLGSGA